MGKQRKRKRKSKPQAVRPKGPPAGGAPSKLTHKLIARAATLYGKGMFTNHVAAMCGVSQRSMERWLKAGAEALIAEDDGAALTGNDALYAKFCREVGKAQGLGIESHVDNVERISYQEDSPSAALSASKFYLSIADRRYTERARTELTGADGGAVKLEVGGSMADAINNALAEVPGLVLDGDDDDDDA